MKTLFAILALAIVSFVSTVQATPVLVGEYYTWTDDGLTQYSDPAVLLGTEYYWYTWPPMIVEHWYLCQHNHMWGNRTHHEQWWDDETFESWETVGNPEWIDIYWDDEFYWDEYYFPAGGGGGDEP